MTVRNVLVAGKGVDRWLLLLTSAAAWVVICGCATTEPENETARPWNEPKTWETGLPPGMTQGR